MISEVSSSDLHTSRSISWLVGLLADCVDWQRANLTCFWGVLFPPPLFFWGKFGLLVILGNFWSSDIILSPSQDLLYHWLMYIKWFIWQADPNQLQSGFRDYLYESYTLSHKTSQSSFCILMLKRMMATFFSFMYSGTSSYGQTGFRVPRPCRCWWSHRDQTILRQRESLRNVQHWIPASHS